MTDNSKLDFEAAEMGDANAMFEIGFYFERIKQEQDLKQAMRFYRRAVAAGNCNAMICLGRLYVAKNNENDICSAFDLFRRAAMLKNVGAFCLLGDCFYSGIGVEQQDLEIAFEWYSRASIAGHTIATERLNNNEFIH